VRFPFSRALTGTALTVGMLAVGAGAAVANDTHTVRSGDTLAGIAAQYDGVASWRELAETNADIITDPHRIFVGQELTLTGAAPAEPAGPETHTVERGETLSSIAARYADVPSWRALAEANADVVPNPNVIQVGQVLSLSGTASPEPSSEPVATESESSSESSSSESSSDSESSSESSSSTPAHNGDVSLSTWDALAECESNQTWDINTGNSFYGGLQFNKMSWDWAVEVGGHDKPAYPHQATRMQQIAVAETLLEIHPAGWGAWPACTRALGLR
jgi:LysM repeat protein